MKYGSKKEAKSWAYEAFRGKLVSTIPTPFDDDLEIHEKDLRNLVRYVIDVKSDAIFITGNVGEFNSLTVPERKRVAEIVIDEDTVRVTGEWQVNHRELGLRAFRAAAGLLRVAERMTITFEIVAVRTR